MARWYLTSDDSVDGAAGRLCERAGLTSSGRISSPGSYALQTYRKRAVSSENFLQMGESDWICAAGTLIFNGKIGREALAHCYHLFLERGLAGIQEQAIGHYALAIRVGDQISICTDPLGAFSLYYCISEAHWFITNSLSLCAGAASSRTLVPDKLLVQVLQTNLPGEETFYEDIRRLFGPQSIRIGLRERTCRVEEIPAPRPALDWNLPTIEEEVAQYTGEVRSVFQQLVPLGRIGLFGTGGLDSRTVLSALLDQGADIHLMYGIGNSRLSDFHERDAALAEEVAQSCGVPFQRLNWSGMQPHSEPTLRDVFSRYGFRSEIYGAPESFLRDFEGGLSPYPGLMVGGYSPAFSTARPWEREASSFPFEMLLADIMRFQGGTVEQSRCLTDKQTYREVARQAVRRVLAIHHIDYPEDGAPLETYVKARLLLHVRAEARFLNFANEFGYYVAPFMTGRLYDPLIAVPPRYRKGDEFQLRLIQRLAPHLVRIPLHSYLGSATVDERFLRMVREASVPPESRLRQMAKRALPAPMRKAIGHAVRRGRPAPAPHQDRNTVILETYSAMAMRDPMAQRWFRSTTEFTPKDLARICQYLTGVNALGYRT